VSNALFSKKEIGAQRYMLRVGHSEEAGLGGEGWLVRMSDHFSDFDTAQRYVKSEDYEALRLRFVKACERVTELESNAAETPVLPKLEYSEHCSCCQRNKITVEVFSWWTCPNCRAKNNSAVYHTSCPHCATLRPSAKVSGTQS
jgi:hypothetical protein